VVDPALRAREDERTRGREDDLPGDVDSPAGLGTLVADDIDGRPPTFKIRDRADSPCTNSICGLPEIGQVAVTLASPKPG
jgi:hypothetical protein